MFAFARALFERRIPQILAVYLGASWGIVQFVDFLTPRLDLSATWTTVTLVGLALLIPSVVLFAWNHGRPGRDEWQPSEKVGVPINLVVVVVVFFVAFDLEDLRAVLTTETGRDESGKIVEIKVANDNYRKRLAIFNFDAAAQDTSLTWLQYALPAGVAGDLSQDMFVDARPSAYFREKLRQLGYKDEVGLPLNVKRKIAEEAHLRYFTDADVSHTSNGVKVDLALYDNETGVVVKRRQFENADLFVLIDEITASLKSDLDIPQTKASPDLPLAEVFTNSLPAFREYANGLIALQIRDDWPAATRSLQKAVELDPTFAMGHAALHNLLLFGNQADASMVSLQKAMDNLYRLPERVQYDVKAEYYMMKQDKDKAYAVAELKTKLFESDIAAWQLLAQFQLLRDDKAGMIRSYRKILELDPSRHEMLREIGRLHEAQGDFENALGSFTQYAERFGSNPDAYLPLGRLQRLRGERGEASKHFERVLVLAPGNVEATIGLGLLAQDTGDFAGALKLFETALADGRTSTDRVRALERLANYYSMRGQLRRSIEYTEQFIRESSSVQPAFVIAMMKLSSIAGYMEAGQRSVAQRILHEVSAQLHPPFDGFSAIGEAELYISTKQWPQAEAAVARVEQAIGTHGFQFLQSMVLHNKARIAEGRGDCNAAIPLYERNLALDPTKSELHVAIGRCYLGLKQTRKAIEHIEQTLLTLPSHPRGNYEIALAYVAAGDRMKALEHLRHAVDAWHDADPGFEWAARAKAKLKEVEGGR